MNEAVRNAAQARTDINAVMNLRLLRWASLAEGVTLVLLVCLAVPLKRLAGMPEFVAAFGPLHGAAFIVYIAVLVRASSAGLLTARQTAWLVVAAFVPFGAFFMARQLKRKAAVTVFTVQGSPPQQ